MRHHEPIWTYQNGASQLFPDAHEAFIQPIPASERHDLINAYHRRLTGSDDAVKVECAQAWSQFELRISRLHVDEDYIARAKDDDKFAVAFARIECHYFVNAGFLQYDGQLLDNATKLKDINGVIVQGRYDVVCPPKSAYDLSKVWTKGKLIMVPDAGHSCKEDGIVDQLVRATDAYRTT